MGLKCGYKTNKNRNCSKKVSKRLKVDSKFLEYIGITKIRDESCMDMWYFNVLDPSHEKYKSTVTYTEEF